MCHSQKTFLSVVLFTAVAGCPLGSTEEREAGASLVAGRLALFDRFDAAPVDGALVATREQYREHYVGYSLMIYYRLTAVSRLR